MSETKAKTGGKRTAPKGVYVNLPEAMRKEIKERCEDTLRTEGAEIAWIVREYIRSEAEEAKVEDRIHSSASRSAATA